MAAPECVDLSNWLEIQTGTESIAPLDPQLLASRLTDVAALLFPDEVVEALGVSALEGAVSQGLLGPPEAARSLLCDPHLFSGYSAEPSVPRSGVTTLPNPEPQGRSEVFTGQAAHHPRNGFLGWKRFEKALFDTSTVSYVSFSLAVAARVFFSWMPPLPSGTEPMIYIGLLLALCADRCAVKKTLKSNPALVVINAVLHLCLLLSSKLLAATPVGFPSSLLTHVAALGIMLTSFTESYFFRLISQYMTLLLVLLDGFLPSIAGGNAHSATVENSLSSSTALTIAFCLILSSFMSATVKYTTTKSYSGNKMTA